jgi:DNA-binding transcriptional ArsR family regulator
MAVLRLLADKELTVKQLAGILGAVPASVHYHVKVLERAGLVRLVETRERSGILEKYYRAVAREFVVDQSVGSIPEAPVFALESVARDIRDALPSILSATAEEHVVNSQVVNVPISRESASEFASRLERLVREFAEARDDSQPVRYSLALAIYPTLPPGRPRASQGGPTEGPTEGGGDE